MGKLSDLDELILEVPETGCLRWTGPHTVDGRGRIFLGMDTFVTARVAYERVFGPIPAGWVIDHVYDGGCRYKDCINTEHLEAVTPAENSRRARAAQTHCKYGHEWSPDNTQMYEVRGYQVRRCMICRRNTIRKQNALRKQRLTEARKG